MPKTVLITGVSSGIGRITAELMATSGWQVAATSRDPVALKEWAEQHGIFVIPLDLTSDSGIATAVTAVLDRFGGIDVLVNNAGYGVFGPLEGTSAAEIETQFRTNVLGPISLVRQVLPIMRARKGGTIITISSIGGRTAAPFASLYHAAKFALEGFSESLRYEASQHNIRVKVIEPAHFKTGFITRTLHLTHHPDYEAQFSNYMQWVYREDQKAPPPEPVAAAILRAAQDDSGRLRYPVKGRFILALTALLPDRLWRSLMGAGLTRRPKQSPQ
jgi:NAD(P)-dependent dehydrogenase (short-subunit alcohol dehydrogenase family)